MKEGFLKPGQMCKVKKPFEGAAPFIAEEEYVFLGTKTYADKFSYDGKTSVARLHTLDGKSNFFALPNDHFSEEWLEPLDHYLDPADIDLGDIKYSPTHIASNNFTFQGHDFFAGEELKLKTYRIDPKKKQLTLEADHDNKPIEITFPFLSLDTGPHNLNWFLSNFTVQPE